MSFPTPQQPQQFTQPQTWAPQRKRRTPLIVIASAVVAVLVAGGVYLVAFRSTTVRGSVTLASAGAGYGTGDCHGTGSFSDITAGAPVEITDGSGKTIALGKLDAGQVVNKSDCRFSFAVDAPRTDIYGVQVSHRGVVKFSRAEVEAGIALGIGS